VTAAARGPMCRLCGHETVVAFDRDDDLGGVTSDCRPWPAVATTVVCPSCGCAQKALDDEWRDQCRRIYDSYRVYRQGTGGEQAVFGAGGLGVGRSLALLTKVLNIVSPAETGRLVDLGCGDGAFLRHVARLCPNWRLTGVDLGDHYRAAIEAIPGVDRFHTGSLVDLPAGTFDLVTALHVVEHIEEPVEFLTGILGRLAEGGRLIVEVPDIEANPFDSLIVDHANHFSLDSLTRLLRRAGFVIDVRRRDWIPRELSLVASAARPDATAVEDEDAPARVARTIKSHRVWLRRLRDEARAASADGVGLFGTSIAASWLAGNLGMERIRFFVDEDASRVGTTYLGRPVLAPSDIPAGETVVLPMTPAVAASVASRNARPGISFAPPPDMSPIVASA